MQQRLARIALLLIAMGSLPSALIAQASAYAPACPAGKTPLIDSSEVVVELAAGDGWHDRRYSDEQRLRILYYADAIGQRFVAPLTLGEIPVLAEMPRGAQQRDNGARLVLSGSLVLLVAPDGRMHLLAWQQRPLSAPLAQALTNAARMAEDSGNFASILPAGQTKGIDTLLLALRSRFADSAGGVPLMRARVNGYVAETPSKVLRGMTAEYPDMALRAGVQAGVNAVFVIGSDARAVMPSLQFTRADWQDFMGPVRSAIQAGEFIAATSGGCTVPSYVMQLFQFKIRRSP